MDRCCMMHGGDTGWKCVKKHCLHIFYRIIHCTWVYPLELFPPFFGYYFFNVMLVVLQMLHIYWAVLILRMFFKCIFSTVCLPVFLCVYKEKCMKTPQILSMSCCCCSSVHPHFVPLLCGSSLSGSWRAMTGAMKTRKTVTHRRKETTNRVTRMALRQEAGPLATDTGRQTEAEEKEKRTADTWTGFSVWIAAARI